LQIIPRQFLANNDSYHFFAQAGGLIKTGPTGTNVNDLAFLFAFQGSIFHISTAQLLRYEKLNYFV